MNKAPASLTSVPATTARDASKDTSGKPAVTGTGLGGDKENKASRCTAGLAPERETVRALRHLPLN